MCRIALSDLFRTVIANLITRLFHCRAQLSDRDDRRIEGHPRLFGGEIDARLLDSRDFAERLFDTPYARGAGHPRNGQDDRSCAGRTWRFDGHLRASWKSSPSSRIISSSRPSLNPV